MSELVEVKTAELDGPALDWCVCMVATGAQYHNDYGRATLVMPGAAAMMDGLKRPGYAASVPDYSSDWVLGGPLIDKHGIEFKWITDATIEAYSWTMSENRACGGDHLVAAGRLVAMELGELVQVPVELVRVAKNNKAP